MSWALKALSSALKNKTFPLKPGLTLGRQGEIVVPDSKSSAIHARINHNGAENWTLEDNNSKNGVRVNGERISSQALEVGLVFYIGDIGFEVIEIAEESVEEDDTATPKTPPPPPATKTVIVPPTTRSTAQAGTSPQTQPLTQVATQPATPTQAVVNPPPPEQKPSVVHQPVAKKGRFWNEVLVEFLTTHEEKFKDRPKSIVPLQPAVVLEFVRGIQTNSRWVVGYGPRQVGATCFDLPIWEPGAPSICFELEPIDGGVMFQTVHREIVLLNGEQVDKRLLNVGDTIGIFETVIEVDFIE